MSIKQAIEALDPCPFCGMDAPDDLSDTLYPSGTYRRLNSRGFHHYISMKDRKPGDEPCWEMNCTQNMGGCGASMHADSRADVIAKWNRRAALRSMPAEPVAYAGRVAQLEAALQAAGDLAASSRSGPAKAESLQGIEEICTEALERRGDQFALFVPQVVHDIANEICQAVAELPDRNSPEDWPEAMLVTHDELQFIVTEAIAALTTTSGDSHG